MNYRKIWENVHGPIPKDERGISFDIHHIDGNRKNNEINNLICVSVYDHYKIHLKQFNETKSHKDRAALNFLASRLEKQYDDITGHIVTEETREKIRQSLKGRKRPAEVVEKVKSKLTDYKWSDEDIEKRRLGLIEYYKTLSEEDRMKNNKKKSESHKGLTHNDETKLKLAKLNTKLSDDEVIEIDGLIKEGITYKKISEQYNISQSQISSLKQRKTYYWVELDNKKDAI